MNPAIGLRTRLALRSSARLTAIARASSTAERAFTLIELLVVVVILGALAGVGYPVYLAQLERANYSTAASAATAAAKSCAALIATGEEATWTAGSTLVTAPADPGGCVAPASPTDLLDFTATAGTGTQAQTVTAQLRGDGAVLPPEPFAP